MTLFQAIMTLGSPILWRLHQPLTVWPMKECFSTRAMCSLCVPREYIVLYIEY